MSADQEFHLGLDAFYDNNHQAALSHFNAAHEAGVIPATHMLAAMYHKGLGVAADATKAVGLYQQAAEGGFSMSANNLAIMYRNGEGVEPSTEKYLEYSYKGAMLGNAQCQFNMGQAYRKGEGVPVNPDYARQYYLLAAEQDYSEAQNELALVYLEGNGVEQDVLQAYCWLTLAARNGNPLSPKNMELIEQRAGDALEQLRSYAEAFVQHFKSSREQRSAPVAETAPQATPDSSATEQKQGE